MAHKRKGQITVSGEWAKHMVQESLKNYVVYMKKKWLLALKGHVTWEGNIKEMRKT